jgi:hypothetical protein
MKQKLLIAISLVFFCLIANAQAPTWRWAMGSGGITTDYGNSVSTDAGGNVFVTGYFKSPSITFGTTTLRNTDSTGNSKEFYIVKYDGSGNVLWAKCAKGASNDGGNSISTDASGNVFVTGYFQSSSITFGTTVLLNSASYTTDIFIVKYDGSGNVLWAKSAGGSFDDYGNSVSTDASGNVFVTGYFQSSSITFGTTVLTNAGSNTTDIFIVKYDGSGNVLFAKREGGTSDDCGSAVSTDVNGNVFVTGYFKSASITLGTTTLTNAGSSSLDIFVVKYDGLGTVLWTKSAGGTSDDGGNSITTDTSGNVFITGYFKSSSITFGTTVLTNAGSSNSDIFIVKYNGLGNMLWAKSAGGTSIDYCNSICTDVIGNVFATGYFLSSSITFGTTVLSNGGSYTQDIFIVKYDGSGNVLWAKSQGGNNDDAGNGISTNTNGNIFVTGYFQSYSITFAPNTLWNADYHASTFDIFVSKLNGIGTDVNEWTNEASFLVYPNPTKGVFKVANGSNSNIKIEIYNAMAEIIYKSESVEAKTEIDLSKEPKGIYFIRLTQDNKTFETPQKLIITN